MCSKNSKDSQKRITRKLLIVFVSLTLLIAVSLAFLLVFRERFFPAAYRQIVQKEAGANHFDPLLIAAINYIESRFGPSRVSPKGDIGLMQVQPSTLKELERSKIISAGQFDKNDLKNPEINVFIGTAYLKKLEMRILSKASRRQKIEKWFDGDPMLVMLHSYNAGPTLVLQDILDKADSEEDYDTILLHKRPTTVQYARDIMRIYHRLELINWIIPYDSLSK